MISGIANAITKPGFQNLIQNTTAQVAIETSLKATGRPLFTLMDKHADAETKKYSATKELLYQVLCLGIYLAVIPITFTKAGFAISKKLCNKINKHPEFLKEITSKEGKNALSKCSINMFKNENGLLALHKLGQIPLAERFEATNKTAAKAIEKLSKNLDSSEAAKEILQKIKTEEAGSDFFRQFYLGKGGVEMGNIVGSVVGLTVLAPEISHLILHPIMHALGMEKPAKPEEKIEQRPLDKTA